MSGVLSPLHPLIQIPLGTPVNAINIIAPYRHLGMWVFDDARVGLAQEPFVEGADVHHPTWRVDCVRHVSAGERALDSIAVRGRFSFDPIRQTTLRCGDPNAEVEFQ
jgi:hypothetical protein